MVDLKGFREANNLTQAAVASYLGVSKTFICQIEKGINKFPREHLESLLNNDKEWDISLLSEQYTEQCCENKYFQMIKLRNLMYDHALTQNQLAEILHESQPVISLLVNERRMPLRRHIDCLIEHFGKEEIDKYTISDEEYLAQKAQQVESTIIPAEIINEIKEETVAAESVPILSEDLATATDLDIRAYLEENGDELELINPSQMLRQADLAEKVMRPSMLPTFAPGDIVFIRFLKDKQKLIDGETYYFDLRSMPTMIRKLKIEGDRLRLIAQNPNFGDIITNREDVVNVARIVGLLRMTFNDFYSDIEVVRKQKEEQVTNLIRKHSDQVQSLINQIGHSGERENRLIDIIEKNLSR